ncbi:nuclear division Rft1 protein, putative [Talaromyces stipitatus ATCC 10500]|uniref:Man(5)GlcNAc(2)-PP-dolichol translocation protein RFT1 n=1 Tax=Talaromyces stipitatus (strain ATCC 10500 / CBS 375.48 / QM 6759 / NRRL 1006) TaxID=441959 RepID=B8LTL6_TALSN|nr:nuclear division Rft1 protein, putative [Talaromyces stipitatus ATCC 10500]EED23608.1 nuclear division Rft1 protein, putative [Talaromyces stipitatus ATCC 10500]
MDESSQQPPKALHASLAYGTSFLILIQVVSRFLTFASNQLVLRHLSPEVFGVATQLELYYITVLYFSRESVRAAIQRQPVSSASAGSNEQKTDELAATGKADFKNGQNDATSSQTVINMAYIAIALGLPLSGLFAFWYQSWTTQEVLSTPYFQESLRVVGLSCMIELATEPFFAVVQQRMLYKERAVVETTAAFARSIATYAIAIWAARGGWDAGVLPFAMGYIAYAAALICGYYWKMLATSPKRNYSFWLIPIHSRNPGQYIADRFSRILLWLGANLYLQLIVKHFLTQGDSMILATFSTLRDQGIYSFAANYGGLVARMVFQPIEESSRNLWSKQLNTVNRDKQEHISQIEAAKSHLIDMLRAYAILAVLALSIAPDVVPIGLKLLMGSSWKSEKVQELLSAYCCYIPFLAFNGITEAFVSAAISPADMRKQTAWMTVFTLCFGVASFLLLTVAKLGAIGLVWANIINMSVRTIWSLVYIRGYLQQHDSQLKISDFSANPQTLSVLVLATSRKLIDYQPFGDGFYGVLATLGFATVYGLLILFLERDYILDQYKKHIRGR